MPSVLFLQLQNAPKSLTAAAWPQTPLGKLQCSRNLLDELSMVEPQVLKGGGAIGAVYVNRRNFRGLLENRCRGTRR